MKTLVTGGAGFIGSNFIHLLLSNYPNYNIINIDNLTYAGNKLNLSEIENYNNYSFEEGDICNKEFISMILSKYQPECIINFAAETHVDNSIINQIPFLHTNILGVSNLLDSSLEYIKKGKINNFKFIHVSTDEVYGSLDAEQDSFTEDSIYKPSSVYSASKASSDHLVYSYFRTHSFPAIITNCSNNYGPRQHSEKLIPKTIASCINKEKITVYGTGKNIRDWIHVDDHNIALIKIMENGRCGEKYNIGGSCELENMYVVKEICEYFYKKDKNNFDYMNLITMVDDRKGHDFRYAINQSKIENELGFKPKIKFKEGLSSTIEWYISKLKNYS